MYIPIDKDIFIEYEGGRATVYDKRELQKELDFNKTQIESLPEPVTDKELLAWAKENYPQSNTEQSRQLINEKIVNIEEKLGSVKEIK